MTIGGHARQTPDKGIHVSISWTFVDAAARAAFTPTSGVPTTEAALTPDDLGKFAWDLDSNAIYMLTATGPAAWVPIGGALSSITLTAGDGLTGGGDLTANRTFDVVANADGSIVVNPDDIQVGVLATDAQHGDRGGGSLHSDATTSVAGFLSASDKTKLDSVSSGAAALTSSAPADVTKATAVVGVATDAARADHKHDVSTAAPGTSGLGTTSGEGTATSLARSDHTHQSNTAPADVTKAAAAIGTSGEPARADHKHDVSTAAPTSTGVSTASAEGSATSLARSDHTHQSNTAPVNVTKATAAIGTSGEPARADHKHDVSTAAPAAAGLGTTSGEGSATTLARSDHTHQSNTTPATTTAATAVIGTSTEPARADHKHDVSTAAPGSTGVSTASSAGSATSLARSDHTHQSNTAPSNVTKATAAIGTSGEPARADHKHDVSTAAPAAAGLGTTSGEGSATTLARSDHTHQSNTAPATTTKATAVIGTSTEPARADHKHDVSTAAPSQGIGGGNSEGSATSLARSDHNHAIRETAGPTDLTVGAILDGQFIARSGTSLVGVGIAVINGFRLTGVSGTPIMTSDNTALSTIYMTPFSGNAISLYNGTTWQTYASNEVSLAVTGRTTDLPFDIFAYASGGAPVLEFLNWSSATARATALTRQDGVWVKSGDATRRYLGTCRPRSATTYSWVAAGIAAPVRFDLWNMYNRVDVAYDLYTTTNTWTYTTATWRQAQGSANYQVDVVAGLQECRIICILTVTSRNSAFAGGNNPRQVGVGFDSTTAFVGSVGSSGSTGSIDQISQAVATVLVPIGRHFAAWLEISQAASTTTWVGDDGGTRIRSGMQGSWNC